MDLTALCDVDAEMVVCAAAMKSPEAFFDLSSSVTAECFSHPLCVALWRGMETFSRARQRYSVLELAKSVADPKAAMKIFTDGQTYAVSLQDSVWRISDLSARRNIALFCDELAGRTLDLTLSPTDIASKGSLELARAVQARGMGVTKHQAMQGVSDHLASSIPCYSTGLPRLDDLLGGGLYASKLYALAARKKVGKTIILGTISANLNAANIPHLFIALEMTPTEIELRQTARSLRVEPIRLIRGREALSPVDPRDAIELIPNTPNATIYEGRPGATLDEIERMIFAHAQQGGIKGVMLDYWQLVQGKAPKETEEWHLRVVAQRLADLTRRLGLWIIIACQLNQEGNSRGGEGIKLACDAYMSLHREKGSIGAWIDLEECRYTGYGTLGDEMVPGLILEPHGPYFREA